MTVLVRSLPPFFSKLAGRSIWHVQDILDSGLPATEHERENKRTFCKFCVRLLLAGYPLRGATSDGVAAENDRRQDVGRSQERPLFRSRGRVARKSQSATSFTRDAAAHVAWMQRCVMQCVSSRDPAR